MTVRGYSKSVLAVALVAIMVFTALPGDLFAGRGASGSSGSRSSSRGAWSGGGGGRTSTFAAPTRTYVSPARTYNPPAATKSSGGSSFNFFGSGSKSSTPAAPAVKAQPRDSLGRFTSPTTPIKALPPVVFSPPASTRPLATNKVDSAAASALKAQTSQNAYRAANPIRPSANTAQSNYRPTSYAPRTNVDTAAAVALKRQQSQQAYRAAHPAPVTPVVLSRPRPTVVHNVTNVTVVKNYNPATYGTYHRTYYSRYYAPSYRPRYFVRSYYNDPIDMYFWYSLLDMSAREQAMWAYNHQAELDRQRIADLQQSNAQFAAEYNQLLAQKAAQNAAYQPTGVDASQVYNEAYLKKQAELKAAHDAEVAAVQKYDAEKAAYAAQQAAYDANANKAAEAAAAAEAKRLADEQAQQQTAQQVADQKKAEAEQAQVDAQNASARAAQAAQQAVAAQKAADDANSGHGFLFWLFVICLIGGVCCYPWFK